MQAEAALQTFAEVAIGVAGFSAILVALRAESRIQHPRRWRWGIALIFTWSLGALALSVLPYISFYWSEQVVAWGACLGIMATYTGISGAAVAVADHRLNRAGIDIDGGGPGRAVPTSRTMHIARSAQALATASLIVAAYGFPRPAVYLAGLTFMLGLALWGLIYMLFASQPIDRQP